MDDSCVVSDLAAFDNVTILKIAYTRHVLYIYRSSIVLVALHVHHEKLENADGFGDF